LVRYLRLSVTDRCDMACVYCMPRGYRGSPRQDVLTFEELVRVVRVFHAVGVHTVRLTGGEPLVRRSVVDLCRAISTQVPGVDLALTTNGALLVRLAEPLARAGVRRVNVSVDSLDPAAFSTITRGGRLEPVLRGIDAALDAGITEVKTNTVVLRHHNLREVPTIASWALSRGFTPRFIELMPLGEGAALMDQHVPWTEVRDALAPVLDVAAPEKRAQRGPASYLPARGGGEVGFITALTTSFCDVCDRVRVTSQGEIRACLASPDGVSLRDLLRGGASDDHVVATLRAALAGKDAHAFHAEGHGRARDVVMTRVGG
jgi:cyclic pyranopterin phosphate synthase